MLPKEQRDLIMLVGRYKFYKLKDLGITLTVEAYKEYEEEQKKEKRIKDRLGSQRYYKMKDLNLSYKDFLEYEKKEKCKRKEQKNEKDKTRWKTYRFIERYCNLDMRCQICGTEEEVEIHHPNYDDYLKVNLLCKKHHTDLHKFRLIPPEIIDLEKNKNTIEN